MKNIQRLIAITFLCTGLFLTACGENETPAEAPVTAAADPAIATEAREETYFTPAQQEGPYYTVEKPADRDNDLVDFAGATAEPAGQILEFSGKVYDANGMPIEGITVEIWQTDGNGIYLHAGDPSFAQRDPNFQGYGEALTAADGGYSFRTLLPGLYEPRPRHIHVKIKLADQELLTTQFYFAGELELQGEDAALLVTTEPGVDANGAPILVGERDVILNVTLPNS